MDIQVGDKFRCNLHYSGKDHALDYELLKVERASDPRRDGRPVWRVKQLGNGETFGCADLSHRVVRKLTDAEIAAGDFL